MQESRPFPWRFTFVLGLGFFGISLVWPIFNNFVPLLLADRGVGPALIGFILTWDNYFNIVVQPLAGALSDRTRTRWGRRLPWLMVGAPLAAVAYALIPWAPTVGWMMLAIGLANFALALFRSPTIALLGDLFRPEERSQANGVINFMGGVGAILAFVVGGALYNLAEGLWGKQAAEAAPFAFGAGMLLLAAGAVVWGVREPAPQGPPPPLRWPGWRLRSWRLDAQPGFGRLLLALVAWFWAYSILEAWLSSFGRFTLGLSPGDIALYTAVLPLTFVVAAIPAGWVAARLGRKRTILLGLALMVPALLVGGQVRSPGVLMALLAFLGAAWALVNVNSLPLVYDFGPEERIGLLTGLYYIASNIALVAGPPVMGWLLQTVLPGRYEAIFPVAGLGMALAVFLVATLPSPGTPRS